MAALHAAREQSFVASPATSHTSDMDDSRNPLTAALLRQELRVHATKEPRRARALPFTRRVAGPKIVRTDDLLSDVSEGTEAISSGSSASAGTACTPDRDTTHLADHVPPSPSHKPALRAPMRAVAHDVFTGEEGRQHESQPLPFTQTRVRPVPKAVRESALSGPAMRTRYVRARYADKKVDTDGGLSTGGVEEVWSGSGRSSVKRPAIYYAKYGTGSSWAMDVFSLTHNAVRAECVDLYNILESIHARAHEVCLVELEEFYVWWGTFERFVMECFDYEADVLLPWVFCAPALGRSSGGGDAMFRLRQQLVLRKEDLLDCIRQLNGTFELRRHVDATDVFETILSEVNGFVPKLLEYYGVQEARLPQVVCEMYAMSARDTLMKRYVQYVKRGECAGVHVVLVCKWMDDGMRERWVRSYLRGYFRMMFWRLERRCYRSHGFIASRFHGRLQRNVRSVAASRLRRRTEFGEEADDISFSSFPSRGGSIRSLNIGGGARRAYQGKGRDGRDGRDGVGCEFARRSGGNRENGRGKVKVFV